MKSSDTIAALIVAGGRGLRARARDGVIPKQYHKLLNQSVLARTLSAFLAHPRISFILPIIHPDDVALYERVREELQGNLDRLYPPVFGGSTRQESTRLGLEALAENSPTWVLIHDGVRPFITTSDIDRLLAGFTQSDALTLGIPVIDTVKRVNEDGVIGETLSRKGLWRAVTPQGFRFEAVLQAHRRALTEGTEEFTDDAALASWAGMKVMMMQGEDGNIKLTTQEDFIAAEARLTRENLSRETIIRTGLGYDIHPFGSGDGVVLCGVTIPHTARLEGHSDADVAWHALTDAILGALGDGDIGEHFPPSDPRWKGAPSSIFLREAVRRVWERHGEIINCDITLIAEAPRIGPHRQAMREKTAALCGLPTTAVGVKATTNEGLGALGRAEGIAALASVILRLGA